jgi:hypothetical protein
MLNSLEPLHCPPPPPPHDALDAELRLELRERRARLLAPQGHVRRRARASSLSDLVQGSLMLKFNKAKRKAEKEMMEQAAGPN